jgi:hypothetical protein
MAATGWVDIEQRLSPAQLHATGLDTLKAEQLALLNRLLREDDAARAGRRRACTVARPVGDAPAAGADTTAPPPAREPLFGFNDGPIVTRLVGTLSGWETRHGVHLRQRSALGRCSRATTPLRKPLDSPEVKLVPGAAGRWFFRIDDDTPVRGLYRID